MDIRQTIKPFNLCAYLCAVFFHAFAYLGHVMILQQVIYHSMGVHAYSTTFGLIIILIIAPYLLFFLPAGFVADYFAKYKILQFLAMGVVVLMAFITLFYFTARFWPALVMTVLVAVLAVFKSPARIGYIKEAFGQGNIARVNAYAYAAFVLATVIASLFFSYLFKHFTHLSVLSGGRVILAQRAHLMVTVAPLSLIMMTSSALEWLATLFLQPFAAANSLTTIRANIKNSPLFFGSYVQQCGRALRQHPAIIRSVLVLALLLAVNQVLLINYSAYVKQHLLQQQTDYFYFLMGLMVIGVLCGALLSGWLSRNEILIGIVPVVILMATICLMLLSVLTQLILITVIALLLGVCGGLAVVPLYALIQFHAHKKDVGKVLAANDAIQHLVILGFVLLLVLANAWHVNSAVILKVLALISLGVFVMSFIGFRRATIRFLARAILWKFNRVICSGEKNIPKTGGVLLLGNHISYLDGVSLMLACPRPVGFTLARTFYSRWYLQWACKFFNIIPISRNASKDAIQLVRERLLAGEIVVVFPEGYLTRNGQIAKFKKGFEKIIADTDAVIVPFYLKGLSSAYGSFLPTYTKRWFRISERYVSVGFGKPLPADSSAADVRRAIMRLSVTLWQQEPAYQRSIIHTWLLSAKKRPNSLAVADSTGAKVSSLRLIVGVRFFQRQLAPQLVDQQNIGLILPLSVGGTIANLAVLAMGKTIVNLNYTTGVATLKYAIQAAGIKTILSSHVFVERLKGRGFDVGVIFETVNVVYLEDVRKAANKARLLLDLLFCKLVPYDWLASSMLDSVSTKHTAAILFSSGSEGQPKGVELTHQNIVTNIAQVLHTMNVKRSDVLLSTMPLFHVFGLTVNMLVPLFIGSPFVCQPDPTDAQAVGRLALEYQATILTGTPTFLNLYVRQRKCYPEMFQSLRLIFTGAEKLSDLVAQDFKQKFGQTLYQAYGVTEASPVVSICFPNVIDGKDWHIHEANKAGTVGVALPGTVIRIVDPSTLEDLPTGQAGLVIVGGPQIMQGYLNNPEKTAGVLFEQDNICWYKTGDKGVLDEDGFLTIVDRYSRFVKTGGEMVSLTAVEQQVLAALGDANADMMAVAVPNDKKGEVIILLYQAAIEESALMQLLLKSSINNLMLPAKVVKLDVLPRLGNGKHDYEQGKQLANEYSRKV